MLILAIEVYFLNESLAIQNVKIDELSESLKKSSLKANELEIKTRKIEEFYSRKAFKIILKDISLRDKIIIKKDRKIICLHHGDDITKNAGSVTELCRVTFCW